MADRRINEQRNRLLACMSRADLALLQPFFEPVVLRFRQRLESRTQKVKTAYFIQRGLGSVVAVNNGRQTEIAIVGWEGMTGLPVVMQVEGEGQCIAADNLRRAMKQSTTLSAFLLRYAHVFFVQVGHAALANAQGKIEERLARCT